MDFILALPPIVIALIALGVIGILAAMILYIVSQKFKVEEDPRINEIEEILPGANCGGCGFPGCHGFADACVKAPHLEGMNCPVASPEVMQKVGVILGMEVALVDPMVAVLRCNGTCGNRKKTTEYDGSKTCQIVHSLYSGETECSYGCVGFGDCVNACKFGAMHMDEETGLPVIDENKCTACGACVKACPKKILELRKQGPKSRRIWVACANEDKGGVAKKACNVACIGCGKCVKECKFDAIVIENNCAYVDFNKCKLCRKCVAVCPTGAIAELNFPPRAQKAPVVKPIVEELPAEKPVVDKSVEDRLETSRSVEEVAVEASLVSEKVVETKYEEKAEEIVVVEEVIVAEEKIAIVEEDIAEIEVKEIDVIVEEDSLPIVIENEITEVIESSENTVVVDLEENTIEVIKEEKEVVEEAVYKQEIVDEISQEEEKEAEVVEAVNDILQANNEEIRREEEQVEVARSIDDIVNDILRESNYSGHNDAISTEPEIDIEALLQRKQEETKIDEIFTTPIRPESPKKSVEQEDKNSPQQLELL